MLRNTTMVAALCASAALVACGGDDKQAQSPQATQCPPGQYFDGQFCQTMQPAATAPAPAATAAPAPATPAPSPVPVATAQAGTPAQSADATTAAAVTQLLGPLAKEHAMPGAQPVGQAIAGNFQEGQSLEAQVQFNPGKCYTVVGIALPPATDLDIQIAPISALPGLPVAVLAADNSVGTTAIVGGKPNCVKWALPMGAPMKVIVTMKGGSGMAAAQVYEK